jgi:UDP-glucose 4-epimerase
MRVVITGGAGFIGSQVGLELFQQGHSIVLVDNLSTGHVENIVVDGHLFGTFVCGDVRDSSTMNTVIKEGDTVLHFAGLASLAACQSDPGLAYDVNVSGTARVLEAARLAKARRVIFASTSAVYENTTSHPHKETDEVSPNLVYSMTKAAAEQVCKGFADCYGLDIIIVRFFNTYGTHQDIHRTAPPFTSYLAREFTKHNTPILYNKTHAKRDYIYITDLVDLIIKMIQSPKHFHADIYNATSGLAYTVREIYEMFQQVSTLSDLEPIFKDPSEFWNSFSSLQRGYPLYSERIVQEVHKNAEGDNTMTCSTFSWIPKVNLRQGVEQIWNYAKKTL